MRTFILLAAVVGSLAACGERPQTAEINTRDSTAFSGTSKAYVNPGWKPGDKASWESQLKARTQYGQNDYTRMN